MRKEIFTIPNLLSCLRIFLVPVFILPAVPHRRMPPAVSAVLIIISGALILFSFVMYIHEYVILWQDIVV